MTIVRIQSFGKRAALPPGCPSFGGQDRLDTLLSIVGGADCINSVSVTGPRHSGRSSLLQQLSSPEVLAESAALSRALIVQADFRELRGQAGSAIQHLIDKTAEAARRSGSDARAVGAASSMTECVRAALRILPGPLLIAIDDFEVVGSDLRKDDQADLRNAVYKEARAGYVVATQVPLSSCLEEFGDQLSDFAPLCTPLELLEPLSARDIAWMIRNAALDVADPLSEQIGRLIHDRIGGFALWVHQALALVFAPGSDPNQRGFLDEASARLDSDLLGRIGQDLQRSHGRLSSEGARIVEGGQPSLDLSHDVLDELRFSGWASARKDGYEPAGSLLVTWSHGRRWVQQKRRESEEIDPLDRLVAAVERLNKRHQERTGKFKECILRPDVFHSSMHLPFLRRKLQRREDFERRVLALAQLLYDGSGGGTRSGRLMLPAQCYSDPACIVYKVTNLRHEFVHIDPIDPVETQRRRAAIAGVYQRYLGVPAPESLDQRVRLGDALLAEAISFIEALTEFCPFAPNLVIDSILPK